MGCVPLSIGRSELFRAEENSNLHAAVTRNVRPARHSGPRRTLRGPQVEFSSTDTWQRCSYISRGETQETANQSFYVVPGEKRKKNVDKHLKIF